MSRSAEQVKATQRASVMSSYASSILETLWESYYEGRAPSGEELQAVRRELGHVRKMLEAVEEFAAASVSEEER